jgi:hypothetical protein
MLAVGQDHVRLRRRRSSWITACTRAGATFLTIFCVASVISQPSSSRNDCTHAIDGSLCFRLLDTVERHHQPK